MVNQLLFREVAVSEADRTPGRIRPKDVENIVIAMQVTLLMLSLVCHQLVQPRLQS